MELLRDIFKTLLQFLPRLIIVAANEGGVFLRCGKLRKTVGPGVYFLLPYIDKIMAIDVTEQVVDLRSQSVTTSDGESIAISGALSYSVLNVEKAILHVQDFDRSIQNYALGVIAHYVNGKTYNEAMQIQDLIDELTRKVRERATEKWGLKILQVWITDNSKHRVLRIMGDTHGTVINEGEEE